MDNVSVTVIASIVSAVIGAIISGFFTYLAERNKVRFQIDEAKKKESKEEYEKRPRLEIKKFIGFDDCDVSESSDLNCLLINFKQPVSRSSPSFEYNPDALDISNLCSVTYVFENTGKTEIDSVCFLSNQPRTTSLLKLEERAVYVSEKYLSYEAWLDKRFIKPGESVTVKFYYVKNKVMISPISAMCTFYLQDINGNLWHQALFCPNPEVENSTRANFQEFKDERDIGKAIECFKKPYLW